MAETMKGLKRTHYCGVLRPSDEGKDVTVCGWVQRQRDLGQLIFVDLRDRTGIVQLAFDQATDRAVFDKAFGVRGEYVLAARGKVRIRSSVNHDIPTGEIEIAVEELRVLSKAQTPPFEIVENSTTAEALRLKYRYLDLRRPDLQRNLLMRHRIAKAARDYFDQEGFIELETPMLIKSTPEGARDFLVPSRVHPGNVYALPQSPQLYKQLCMVAGFDRYIQLARCFRDEDLRADRQPEFTQIDMEMSFVDVEDVLAVGEGFIRHVFKEALGVDIPTPLPRMTYTEAMERYGSDKPDTRFGMELIDLTDAVKGCGFAVFAGAAESGMVGAINVKGGAGVYTRKEIDRLTEYAKGIGAKGLAWVRWTAENRASSFGKFLSEEEMEAVLNQAEMEEGDVLLVVADPVKKHVQSVLGALRTKWSCRGRDSACCGSRSSPSSSGMRRPGPMWPCTIPSPRLWTSAFPIWTASRKRCTPRPTTWCSTGWKWPAAPSASPTRSFRTTCSGLWACPRRKPGSSSASCWTPSSTARRPTAAWASAWTAW